MQAVQVFSYTTGQNIALTCHNQLAWPGLVSYSGQANNRRGGEKNSLSWIELHDYIKPQCNAFSARANPMYAHLQASAIFLLFVV